MGTSSGVPLPGKRNVSSMLLQFANGRCILIDCGEGTQHQLMQCNVRMNRITSILLTHLHGDHCYGVFGLIHSLNMGGRTEDLYICAPRGVRELIETVLRLTGGWNGYKLVIEELDADNVTKFSVPIGDSDRIDVTACPMEHRVPTVGYVFQESTKVGALDAALARSLGASGAQLGELKMGKDVTVKDNSSGVDRVIKASEVLGPSIEPRTVGILQDTSNGSSAVPYLRNCALLVHECTYERKLRDKAIEYGHSTSEMAAQLAKEIKPQVLALTHFSAKYEDIELENLKSEAEEVLVGINCKVTVARDFLEVNI